MGDVPSKLPVVGVGVILVHNGQVLLGKRTGAHGAGKWGFPGGRVEWGEAILDCAARETFEETGLILLNPKIETYVSKPYVDGDKHYVTLYVSGRAIGQPRVMEPEKCLAWEWFDWDNLPKPLLPPIRELKKQGYSPEVG